MTEEENQSPPQGESAPPSQLAASSGLAPNIAAGLACVLGLIGGIIFLLIEKKNTFVRFYAMQSIFFSGAWIAISIALQIILVVLGRIPVLGIVIGIILGLAGLALALAGLVIYIITIVKAFSGVEWEIPWLGALARKQLDSSKI